MENVSCEQKFGYIQTHIGSIWPSLITYYVMCDKRKNKDVTLRLNTKTGRRPILEYSEKFVNALSIQVLGCLVSIELFRLLLHHPTGRLMYPVERCLVASNIICTDDRMLHFRTPPEVVALYPSVDMIKAIEPKFNEKDDMYLEKIFAILSREAEENAESKSSGGTGDEEDGDDEGNGTQDGYEYEDESDALKKHFSPNNCKKNTEGWGENNMIDETIANEVNRMSASEWGKMPGGLVEKIQKANERSYDIRRIIKDFSASVLSHWYRFTRMKVPRRFQEWTGVMCGKVHGSHAKVLFATDASGSMSREDIAKCIAVFESSFKQTKAYFCSWDCRCGEIEDQKNFKDDDKEILGGGGTDPMCVINKIKEEKLRFDGIVFLTDCIFSFPDPEINTKIFIVQTDNAAAVPPWCKNYAKLSDIQKL